MPTVPSHPDVELAMSIVNACTAPGSPCPDTEADISALLESDWALPAPLKPRDGGDHDALA